MVREKYPNYSTATVPDYEEPDTNDMKSWLKVKDNFDKTKKEAEEKVGKWWQIKIGGYTLGKVNITRVCDVEWKPDFESTSKDYRDPFHVWADRITPSKNFKNCEWDVTDGGKLAGVFCSRDGKTSFKNIFHIEHHLRKYTEGSKEYGFYVHSQALAAC